MGKEKFCFLFLSLVRHLLCSMVFKKMGVVDCRGHLLGRLASVVVKQILNGQRVVLTRCEYVNISGSIGRNGCKFAAFLKKRTNSNPTKGPFHFRSPARIVWRAIRGMVPHKLWRGANAMARLKCYEGVPRPYDKKKRMAIPYAVRSVQLRPDRAYTTLGKLSTKYGWRQSKLVRVLDQKRKARSASYYRYKVGERVLKKAAVKTLCKRKEKLSKVSYCAKAGHKMTKYQKLTLKHCVRGKRNYRKCHIVPKLDTK